MAVGIDRAILLETDGRDWDPIATADAIVAAIRAQEAAGGPFDLILFGNESADSGGFQVGIRVAAALGRPCVTGVKSLTAGGRPRHRPARGHRPAAGSRSRCRCRRSSRSRRGINLPRYPSIPGRLRAKKKDVERVAPGLARRAA